MKKLFILLALCAMSVGAWAVPARPGLIERAQPNGDTVRVYLRGDEWAHWMITEDGWQIREDKKGWLRYVRLNRKGEERLSCRKAHNAEQRSKCEIKWINKYGIKKN